MALPRYLYSVTESSRAPLVSGGSPRSREDLEGTLRNVDSEHSRTLNLSTVPSSSGASLTGLAAELELEQSFSSHHTTTTKKVCVNGLNEAAFEPEGDKIFVGSSLQSGRPTSSENSDPGDYVFYKDDTKRTKWEEAALYAHEGEDNDKFYHHPAGRWSKLAYTILHHPAFYITDLVTSILLMLLAFLETPSVVEDQLNDDQKKIVITVHGLLEILLLFILAIDIVLRLIWLRPRHFIRHKRTVFITVILLIMFAEVIAVLIRQKNHFRITRSLRPLFFIDTYLMWGLRRVLRHLLLCFKAILDILLLLLFIVVFFALIGYFEFADVDPDYFASFARSYVSLFITLTTANHPDVMMEAYFRLPASPIFFIIFLIITLYFISNVLLAVVYANFSSADKKKFKKLFLHKREALRHAYNVLADARGIKFHDFLLFMQQYKPRIPEWQVMCIFKSLHANPQQQHTELSQNEFYNFYEMIGFRWRQVTSDGQAIPWYAHFPPGIRSFLKVVNKLVKWQWFNVAMNVIVLANAIFLVVYSLTIPIQDASQRYDRLRTVLPVSFVFVGIYCVEIILRVVGLGPLDYFRKFWNVVDFVVIIVSLVTLALETDTSYQYLLVVRPIKLLRLLRLKRRYRDILTTVVVLIPRLISIGLLLLVVYYSYTILGMEFFSGRVFPGCCNTSWYGVGQYFSGAANATHIDSTPNVYFLNNFDNILRSYVTLFILMVVNNWYIIMEGFASEVGGNDGWARLYFMSFYIITLVVLQVVIAFIVEAFVFRIQATEKSRYCEKHGGETADCGCMEEKNRKKMVDVVLVDADIIKLKYEVAYLDETGNSRGLNHLIRRLRRVDLSYMPNVLKYVGRRLRTKDDLYLLMYRSELTNWIEEQEKSLREGRKSLPSQQWWMWLWKKFKMILEYIFE